MPKLRLFSHVEAGEVEAVDVKDPAVDDHHLAVVADQIVGGARHGDAGLEQVHLELAQDLGAAAIVMGGQRPHADAAGDGGLQRARDLQAIEPEDQDVDATFGLLDRGDDRGDAGVGLNDELHTRH